jgi:CRP-like cAMP-binding protein
MADTTIDTAVLQRFTPLDGLRRENVSALSKKATLHKVPVGRQLFREGDTEKRSYYLVSGEVELRAGRAVVDRLRADTPEAKHPITPGIPRRFSAYAATPVEILVIDSDLLDVLLTWDQTGVYDVSEITGEVPVDPNDWMAILLQVKAFHRIPASNLQAIFLRLERVNYRAGEVVIKQGGEGDYFYAITAGRCSVAREYPLNPAGIKLAELGPGDSFGDEALISDAKRSATVTMLTDGALARLSKSDFNTLLHEPLLQRVSYAEAAERVANGAARWLDVRLPSEFKSWHLAGAINLPLHMMRLNLGQLDASVHHVVVCDTGRRSSAGAFILNGNGYDAAVLQGGLPPAGGIRGQ